MNAAAQNALRNVKFFARESLLRSLALCNASATFRKRQFPKEQAKPRDIKPGSRHPDDVNPHRKPSEISLAAASDVVVRAAVPIVNLTIRTRKNSWVGRQARERRHSLRAMNRFGLGIN